MSAETDTPSPKGEAQKTEKEPKKAPEPRFFGRRKKPIQVPKPKETIVEAFDPGKGPLTVITRGRKGRFQAKTVDLATKPPRNTRTWDVPEDSVIRSRVANYMAMRIEGLSDDEIAKEMDLTKATLKQYLYIAGKNGWLTFTNPSDRLEYGLSNKVVDVIDHHLNARDKKVAIEAAKGLGLFKTHAVLKSETPPAQTVLALKIEMPAGVTPTLPEGVVLGTPRVIEGEVEGEKDGDS